ncbi:hypothetical protein BGW38_009660, partial [Lunasporangiospora selenospora]
MSQDWLRGQGPGTLIRSLIAPVSQDALSNKRCKGADTFPVISLDPDDIRNHVNNLRTASFDPRTYTQKGYALRGSIKTDGHRLQVLAFKLRELLSVRYKRYSDDVLPNRLLSTVPGTDDSLTEIRNVFTSENDVERLLGCSSDQVSYLGIDPGQACVVGAYAYLPPDKEPKIGRNRHRGRRKRGSRGSKPRGSKRGKIKSDSRIES